MCMQVICTCTARKGCSLIYRFFLQIRTSSCMLSHSALYLGFTASEHRAWKSPISTEFCFSSSWNNITTYITGVSRRVFQSITHSHANIWSYKHMKLESNECTWQESKFLQHRNMLYSGNCVKWLLSWSEFFEEFLLLHFTRYPSYFYLRSWNRSFVVSVHAIKRYRGRVCTHYNSGTEA